VLTRVISGAQSGVDLAALDAALTAGLPTGGWMPKGFLAEDGLHPEYAAKYGMRQMDTPNYPARTRKNVQESDGTLILSDSPLTGGTLLTFNACNVPSKPRCVVLWDGAGWWFAGAPRTADALELVRNWLARENIHVLNVAGPRESKCPGIYAAALAFLTELFRGLRE
jgi:hypothetical protein